MKICIKPETISISNSIALTGAFRERERSIQQIRMVDTC